MLRLRTSVTLLVLVLLSGCLSRCGGDPAETPTPEPDATPAEVAAKPEMEPEEETIDRHWDWSDIPGTEATFRKLLEQTAQRGPAAGPDADLRQLELQTQIARTRGLQRDFEGAHAILDKVDKALATQDAAHTERFATVRIRAMLERGRAINSAGEAKEEARDAFVQAWDAASAAHQDGFAVDAAHMVAIVDQGTPGELEWGLKALQLAETSTQQSARKWRGSLYNNLGWTFHDKGEFDKALVYFDKQIVARKESGKEPALRVALWARARCLRSLNRNEEALKALHQLLTTYGDAADDDGFVHEELAENMLVLGHDAKAKHEFARAHALLKGTWTEKSEPERVARLAELGSKAAPAKP
jgi:tetratricopeptide (TPR) repeat protein